MQHVHTPFAQALRQGYGKADSAPEPVKVPLIAIRGHARQTAPGLFGLDWRYIWWNIHLRASIV